MRQRGILGKLRREQDSNLRTGFAGYTLSRRASSTTRAPLLLKKPLQNYRKYSMQTNVANNNYEKLILPCSLVDTPPLFRKRDDSRNPTTGQPRLRLHPPQESAKNVNYG